MTDKELEGMLAIQQMPDAGPWQGTTCPCCGCLVEMRQNGLRSVALTGDETLARYEYRASDLPDALWKALDRLLRDCQWSHERNGFFVESRGPAVAGIAHMLLLAEEAHAKYVHDHGQ